MKKQIWCKYLKQCKCVHTYTMSKKNCKIVFVRTSSNFHDLWQFMAHK